MTLSISLMFAESAKIVEFVTEKTVKIDENGAEKRLHLSGIELFAKANNKQGSIQLVDYDKREELKNRALVYMNKMFPKGSNISYQIFLKDEHGIEYAWIKDNDFNYKIVRDGYALTDVNDPSLPIGLRNRMLLAQNYAKKKGLGLWGIYEEMQMLEQQDVVACGCEPYEKKDFKADTFKKEQAEK